MEQKVQKTTTLIETVFYGEENGNIFRADYVEHNVLIDGEPYYSCRQKVSMYMNSDSPISLFEGWLLAQDRGQQCRNIRRDGGQPFCFFNRQSLQVGYLKLQLSYLKLKLCLMKLRGVVSRVKRMKNKL